MSKSLKEQIFEHIGTMGKITPIYLVKKQLLEDATFRFKHFLDAFADIPTNIFVSIDDYSCDVKLLYKLLGELGCNNFSYYDEMGLIEAHIIEGPEVTPLQTELNIIEQV